MPLLVSKPEWEKLSFYQNSRSLSRPPLVDEINCKDNEFNCKVDEINCKALYLASSRSRYLNLRPKIRVPTSKKLKTEPNVGQFFPQLPECLKVKLKMFQNQYSVTCNTSKPFLLFQGNLSFKRIKFNKWALNPIVFVNRYRWKIFAQTCQKTVQVIQEKLQNTIKVSFNDTCKHFHVPRNCKFFPNCQFILKSIDFIGRRQDVSVSSLHAERRKSYTIASLSIKTNIQKQLCFAANISVLVDLMCKELATLIYDTNLSSLYLGASTIRLLIALSESRILFMSNAAASQSIIGTIYWHAD
ncbi:hypothetical protein RF11_12186 [Thelohanellus kitauei]|uniref:Uncharacterized protein n=1 Tax=Thelohanellus kitauei TaxID=669202 RepID=A0A0C2MF23_THEKT|nr:hypothetical protein RF11_12186 [Thelohanellus kitauei]